MKVITNNKVFDCDTATTQLEIGKGLMFKRNITPLLFLWKTEVNIIFHTLFMLKPIDILFINSKFEVVDKKTVKPFKFIIKSKAPFQYVLETEARELKDVNIGDKVNIKEI